MRALAPHFYGDGWTTSQGSRGEYGDNDRKSVTFWLNASYLSHGYKKSMVCALVNISKSNNSVRTSYYLHDHSQNLNIFILDQHQHPNAWCGNTVNRDLKSLHERRIKALADTMAESSENHGTKYVCKTQNDNEKGTKVVLGMGPIIPRWSPGTKLEYVVNAASFQSASEAKFASDAFKQAADEWNSHAFGVTITEAKSRATAHFDLSYDGNPEWGYTLAAAFFPLEVDNPTVIVTQFGLGPRENRDILKEVFLHELGHVFGLRHEFALWDDAKAKANGVHAEPGTGGVQFMEVNEKSVMAYKFPPKIQKTDIDGIKAFYKLPPGQRIGMAIVTDFTPQLLK